MLGRSGGSLHSSKGASFLTEKLAERLGSHPHVGEIRHIGLIHALELVEDKASKKGYPPEERVGYQVYKKALERGLILRPLGNVLYFNPPLIINEDELEQAVTRCVSAIEAVERLR